MVIINNYINLDTIQICKHKITFEEKERIDLTVSYIANKTKELNIKDIRYIDNKIYVLTSNGNFNINNPWKQEYLCWRKVSTM